jgi:transcriptional regulator with XRE-family HTH domain
MRIYRTNTIELRKCIIENGIETVNELSIKSGISRNTLGQVLKGNIQPSADVMDKLVSTLDISPEKAGMIFFGLYLRSA